MKAAAKGMSTRYDQPHEMEQAARNQAPGAGLFLRYKIFCSVCKQDQPKKGSKQIQPGRVICAGCANG